jgi:HSP20 family molecular chaperone IbpA
VPSQTTIDNIVAIMADGLLTITIRRDPQPSASGKVIIIGV